MRWRHARMLLLLGSLLTGLLGCSQVKSTLAPVGSAISKAASPLRSLGHRVTGRDPNVPSTEVSATAAISAEEAFQTDVEAAIRQRFEPVATDLCRQLLALFTPMEGYVVSVEGERVLLDLGKGESLQVGQVLEVVRKGAVYRHPLNYTVLGESEEMVGKVEVREVAEKLSIARLLEAANGTTVRPGDRVRVSARKITLALPPLRNATSSQVSLAGLAHSLQTALDQSGRFEVVPAEQLRSTLKLPTMTAELLSLPANLAHLQERWPGSYLLTGVITPSEEGLSLAVSVIAPRTQHTWRLVSKSFPAEQPKAAPSAEIPPASRAGK
ncbi:MAG: hypothetical protein HYY96_10235 [Candidatus Tectomicrobia bacterium]|nr:hypothetical protein [Candidatus Tectomicrobia bacterium]